MTLYPTLSYLSTAVQEGLLVQKLLCYYQKVMIQAIHKTYIFVRTVLLRKVGVSLEFSPVRVQI
jgi:hypothetical protein